MPLDTNSPAAKEPNANNPLSEPSFTFSLPEWFLTNNVKRPIVLSNWQVPADLIRGETSDESSEADEESDTELGRNRYTIRIPIGDSHQLTQVLFDELCDMICACFLRDKEGKLCHNPSDLSLLSQRASANDREFYQDVVTLLAKNIGATLITLDMEDLEDLAWDFHCQEKLAIESWEMREETEDSEQLGVKGSLPQSPKAQEGNEEDTQADVINEAGESLKPDAKGDGEEKGEEEDESEDESLGRTSDSGSVCSSESDDDSFENFSSGDFLRHYFAAFSRGSKSSETWRRNQLAVSAILDAKRPSEDQPAHNSHQGSTILYIHDYLGIKGSTHGANCLRRIEESLSRKRAGGANIIGMYGLFDPSLTKLNRHFAWSRPLSIKIDPPAYSEKIRPKHETVIDSINMRRLRVSLRKKCSSFFPKEALEPSSTWWCREQSRRQLPTFGDSLWPETLINGLVLQISGRAWLDDQLNLEDIQVVLARLKPPQKTGTTRMRATVKTWQAWREEIRDLCDQKEQTLLDGLVNPNEIKSSFEDVVLEGDTKEIVQNLVHLSSFRAEAGSHFLLDQLRIKGVLLYGPPGTGKTHLSRAVAKSTGSNMLAINAASIRNKYVGETEQNIQAAFSLAKKLFPCVLFIDEVDALFYRRSSNDKSWERSALTQFLQEIDGLAQSDKAPFVLAATNRPTDLDEAFLRRLPQKIMIGLPGENERLQILKLFIGDNDIDASVDFAQLAIRTTGFSGSDLRSLCSEAALIWIMEQTRVINSHFAASISSQLCLTSNHFDKAFQKIQGTVSGQALRDIREFSRRFSQVV